MHEKECAAQAGRWRVEYAAELEVARGSAGALDVFATLSTAANSEVNKEATIKIGISSGVSLRGSVGLIGYVLDLADMSHISLPVPQARSFIVSSGRDEKKRTDVEWLKFNVNPPL